MTEKFIIGVVGSPFGLKGFVKVRPLSGEIDHLLKLKSVILRRGEKEQTLIIEEIAVMPPALAMRFAGCDCPEAAKDLQGAELIVGRENAAPLNEGEFYIEDLKGLAVIGENGESLGAIADIIEGGGGELAEIKLENGEKRLVPFKREFFSSISPEKGSVVLQNIWILE